MWSQMRFVFVCNQFHHTVVIHFDILNMLWSLFEEKRLCFWKKYISKHISVTAHVCIAKVLYDGKNLVRLVNISPQGMLQKEK